MEITNKNIIIGCNFAADVLLCVGFPTIHKTCIELLPARYIAFEQLAISFFLILFCSLWKNEKFRHKTLNWFLFLSTAEMLSGIILALSMAVWFNVWIFAIGSLIYTSAITVWLSRAIISFKAVLFKEREREDFDNDYQLACSVSSLIGFGLALIYPPPLMVCLILWGVACFSNLGWITIYVRNKESLANI